jgi:outer membrane immunogenic protein
VDDSLFGRSASASHSGFIGGGQLGFNYQFTNIVLGVEWDFDWTSLDAIGNGVSTRIGFLQASANTRWVSTLAARFGVAVWNGVLLYGKAVGGWVDNSATVTNLTTGASISASNRNSGWVVGAGIEWALAAKNLSAKLEYDFLRLDDLTFRPRPFLGDTFRTNRDIQMLKVGLNYRFGYGGPAHGGPGYGGPGYGGPGYRAY